MKNLTFLILFVFIPLIFAQEPPYKHLTEIVREGNILKIPEDKMGEFMKNMDEYIPKKNFLKPNGEITLDGYVTDAYTNYPIGGVDVTAYIYRIGGEFDTYGPVETDINGYYVIDHIVGVEDEQETDNIGMITYKIINTPFIELNLKKLSKVEIKLYDLLGQEVRTLLNEETSNKIINTDIKYLSSGVYILQTAIDGKLYSNKLLKTGLNYYYGKISDQIIVKISNLEKITATGAIMDMIDSTGAHHSYIGGGTGEFQSSTPRFNMPLLPRMYLDSAFVDQNYTVIDTIKTFRDLLWDLYNIQGEFDNTTAALPLYNFRLFIDTTNCPTEWKAPIRDAIQYWRDTMAVYLGIEPDSLILESPELNDPTVGLNFSAINMYYITEIPNNWDSWRMRYLDASNYVYTGADISLNLSTGMAPIDVYKEINRNIEEYIVGVAYPFDRRPPGMLIDHRHRGEPSTLEKDDKIITKIKYNIPRINRFTYYNRIYP